VRAIGLILEDTAVARELRERGLARARQFSWGASVRRVREIYGEVANQPFASAVPMPAAQAGVPQK